MATGTFLPPLLGLPHAMIDLSSLKAADINLAFGKHATQSSIYLYHSIIPVAGYAVDGNTDGYFLNKSTFKETEKMQTKRSLISVFFILKNDKKKFTITLKNIFVKIFCVKPFEKINKKVKNRLYSKITPI
jgi:hypothetical protein